MCFTLMHECVSACSVVSNSVIPWTVVHQVPLSMEFPSKNTGVGSCFLLLGIFSMFSCCYFGKLIFNFHVTLIPLSN